MRLVLKSRSEKETMCIARHIAQLLRGGEVIALKSDLGGGKTTFTKGLVAGLGGYSQEVTSPTFMLFQEYKTEKLPVTHIDLYRLNEMGIISEELHELFDGQGIVVIEWPDIAEKLLPAEKLITISITRQARDESERELTIEYPEDLSYAIDADVLEDVPCH